MFKSNSGFGGVAIASVLTIVGLVLLAYLLKPLGFVHSLYLTFFVQYPLLFWVPLIGFLIVGGIAFLVGNDYGDAADGAVTGLISGGVTALILFFVAMPFADAYSNRSLAYATDYAKTDLASLKGGDTRITPKEVADSQLAQALNSPTEQPTHVHALLVDGRFTWTGVRDPEGFFREYTKNTTGILSIEGDSSEPALNLNGKGYDAKFKYGPAMKMTDALSWQLRKICYSCDYQEAVALPGKDGPTLMVPFLKYEGSFLVKRPVFGGVFHVHPSGKIDQLSPKEAMKVPAIANSGRMFPESLALKIADVFKYHKGIKNRMFTKEDGYEVEQTEGNNQPYIQDFKEIGPQWVTTMKPRGNKTGTGLVIFTDTQTGHTRLWRVPANESYIGNEKALDVVRGTRLGVVFSTAGAADAQGKFRAVEPRQVIIGGKLHFLVSIIPNAANRVEMTAIVEPRTPGRVVAVFPASKSGDKALIDYMDTGTAPNDFLCTNGCPTAFNTSIDSGVETEAPAGTNGEETSPANPSASTGKVPTSKDAASTLERLLAQNRAEQKETAGQVRDLRAQEQDLLRLLEASKNKPAKSESDEETTKTDAEKADKAPASTP